MNGITGILAVIALIVVLSTSQRISRIERHVIIIEKVVHELGPKGVMRTGVKAPELPGLPRRIWAVNISAFPEREI
jgi:hypothetical protein